MVHAQAAEQMIRQTFLLRPDWAPGLEFFLVAVVRRRAGAAAAAAGRGGAARWSAGSGSVRSAGGSWLAFTDARYLLDPTYPVLAHRVRSISSQTVLSFYREERQRAYIHKAFDRYLSPELVRRIAADPGRLELGGEEREMTVLFCDIRGFSRISEKLRPAARSSGS